jgi:putative copper export protein
VTGRGLRGRRIARAIVTLAAGLIVLTIVVLAFEPNETMGPSVSPFASPITWAGLAASVAGFLWLIRIERAASQPESRRSSGWRATRDE